MRRSSGVARSRIEQSIVLMQPDFPEPVVPAMRMCGMRARSAQTDAPEMSFPSQTESGLAFWGSSSKMSPSVTTLGARLGTSTPTACLPGIGKAVAGVLARGRVEERRLLLGELGLRRLVDLLGELVDEDGMRPGCVPDDVGIRLLAVHRRGQWKLRWRLHGNADGLDGAARGRGCVAGDACRPAEDRAQRGAGEEKRAGPEQEEAEDEAAGAAEQAAEHGVERLPDAPSPLGAEQDHRPGRDEDEPGAERLHVDEGRPRDHEASEEDEDDRHPDARGPDESLEARVDLLAHDTSRAVQPGDECEEEPQAEEPEPEELVVLVLSPSPPRALRLANARGRLGAKARRTLLPRHGCRFRGRRAPSSWWAS